MHKRNIVAILITFILIYAIVLSENSFIQDKSLCFRVWSADSFAWKENHLYIAHGIWTEDSADSWAPDNYQILELDEGTGEFDVKLSVPYGSPLFIEQNEGNLYIVRMNVYNREDESVIRFIIQDAISMKILFSESDVDGVVKDWLWFGGSIYIATSNKMYVYSQNGVLLFTYIAAEMLQNEYTSNHLLVDNGFVYFQDGKYICRLNIMDFNMEIMAKTDLVNESSYHNTYIVLNDYLYYWNNDIHATVALNLETMESVVISKHLFCYCQYYDNGMLVFQVEKHNTRKVDDNVLTFPSGTYKYYNLQNGLFLPEETTALIIDIDNDDSELYLLYKEQLLLLNLKEDSYYFSKFQAEATN